MTTIEFVSFIEQMDADYGWWRVSIGDLKELAREWQEQKEKLDAYEEFFRAMKNFKVKQS